MDIIVKAYYASKAEIDKINSEFLDLFLSLPQKVGHMTTGGYRKPIAGYHHIDEIFENKSKAESKVMKKYIKMFAQEFAEKYGIEIVERVPIQCGIGGENMKYMQTKKQKLGHILDI